MTDSTSSTTAATAPGVGARGAVEAAKSLEKELSKVEGKGKWLRRGVVLLVLAGAIAGGVVWRSKHKPPPPAHYLTKNLSVGDVVETVQSTGVIKPMTEVQVGAQVSGRVVRVLVDFNSFVKRGDLLAEIDPLTFGAQVDQQRAQMLAQKAALARAEANAASLKLSLDRAEKLKSENLAGQEEVDKAKGAYDVAQADIAQAKAQIAATNATIASAAANLSYTKIYSPIDGVVTNRAIDPGQTVAASFQAPVLFVIAEDLSKMRIFADIDEADVGKLQENMETEATVDAFPGEKFAGKVTQVRYNPNTVQGVVTYQAVIEVGNPERKLRPGMTATVTVRTKEAKGVVRIPNAALRFKPSPEKGPDGKPIPKPPEKALEARTGRVYLIPDTTPGKEKIEPRVVKTGITDGQWTVLNEVDLTDGTLVVTDETDDKDGKKGPKLF
ncbi:MAG: efflux RND transporter periplasmic adaptor subunit [Polyangiaceae bacterium]